MKVKYVQKFFKRIKVFDVIILAIIISFITLTALFLL